MAISLKYRDLLPQSILDELDQLTASIRAVFFREHNADGSHGDITARTLTLSDQVLGIGSVTHTGTLDANQLIIGNGSADIKKLGAVGSTTTVLHGNAAGAPSFSAVSLSADVTGTLPIANGGTGQTAQQAAFDALSPVTTRGDLIVRDASHNVRLAVGANHRVLKSDGTDPSWGQVDLTADVSGDLPFANLAQGSALSVLGVTGNATADVASIGAGSDKQVLRRQGTALGFGAVDLTSSAAVAGPLPVGFGGTNSVAGLSGTGVMVSDGTSIVQGVVGTGLVLSAGTLKIDETAEPRCSAYYSTTQSINNATFTAATLNTEDYDVGSMHDNVTNNTRITAPVAGLYLLTAGAQFDAHATGQRVLILKLNGTTFLPDGGRASVNSGTYVTTLGTSLLWVLAASDYVEMYLYQDTGGALNTGSTSRFAANFLQLTLIRRS